MKAPQKAAMATPQSLERSSEEKRTVKKEIKKRAILT